MNIKEYIYPLFKWWWLILLSTLIAAGTSYYTARSLPPVYLARTTLMVGQAISDPNPSGTEFGTAQQLANYYTNIALREPIKEATQDALGLDELPKYEAVAVPYSPFIEISVTDTKYFSRVSRLTTTTCFFSSSRGPISIRAGIP